MLRTLQNTIYLLLLATDKTVTSFHTSTINLLLLSTNYLSSFSHHHHQFTKLLIFEHSNKEKNRKNKSRTHSSNVVHNIFSKNQKAKKSHKNNSKQSRDITYYDYYYKQKLPFVILYRISIGFSH